MILTNNGDAYLCVASYEEKDIPKAAGCRWNPKLKQWYTTDVNVARKLIEYADVEAKEKLASVQQQHLASIEASRAVDADIAIPAPAGLTYLPYQKAGIAYVLRHKHTLIGDEMGLGKTVEAIGAINADDSIQSVLVVCPASLKLNWKRELERWLTRPLLVDVADGSYLPRTPVVIANYDIIAKHHAALCARGWDLLIADESHFLKNPKAIRTKSVLGDKETSAIAAARKLFLTGTPILNRPIELWPLLKACGVFTNWKKFVERYCDGHMTRFGWDVTGASHLDELQEVLRSQLMIRRLKKDVLTELPAKRRQVIEVSTNGAADAVRAERAAWAQREDAVAAVRAEVELAKAEDDEVVYKAAIAKLQGVMTAAFTEISILRHEVALAKIPAVVEHAENLLESVDKLVIFAHHHDVTRHLVQALDKFNPVRLTGEEPLEERQRNVDQFQKDPGTRVIVCSIRASGMGWTLTAASTVLFAELDWVPGMMTQAEDRLHRIGQRSAVLVQHLVLDGSLDASMAKTIVAKQEIADLSLDTEAVSEPVAPEATEEAEKPVSASRSQLAEVADKLTPKEVSDIHHQLQVLAGLCDGARRLDGAGFNRYDAPLGHSLAERAFLTAKQAALGQKLIRKYRGQLGEEIEP